MATGTIPLPVGAAILPDGSSGNAAPGISRIQGTETNPKKHLLGLAFDPSTSEHAYWTFRMPTNYASGGVVNLLWQTNDVGAGEECVWAGKLIAVTATDADTPQEHANTTETTATSGVNTTEANRLISAAITLSAGSLDSVAAGDLVTLMIRRAVADAADDLTSDAVLLAVDFEYTTT